jgi:hypothetical protein
LDSRYDEGLRLAEDARQELVTGGYTIGTKTFDALVFGYYEGEPQDPSI